MALAIDGGAVDAILEFIGDKGLALAAVTNTHAHPDHTSGNQMLLEKTRAPYRDHQTLAKKGEIPLEDEIVKVYPTPGHTDDSVVFHWGNYLITGDTLFNGTVGTCFSGDLKAFHRSIRQLVELPDDTVIYAGHDYLEYAMAFARLVEPGNRHIDAYLEAYTPDHVFSTLGDELKVNPFLRYNHPEMIGILKERGREVTSEYERFEGVMHLE